jgi:hypothetical protein
MDSFRRLAWQSLLLPTQILQKFTHLVSKSAKSRLSRLQSKTLEAEETIPIADKSIPLTGYLYPHITLTFAEKYFKALLQITLYFGLNAFKTKIISNETAHRN